MRSINMVIVVLKVTLNTVSEKLYSVRFSYDYILDWKNFLCDFSIKGYISKTVEHPYSWFCSVACHHDDTTVSAIYSFELLDSIVQVYCVGRYFDRNKTGGKKIYTTNWKIILLFPTKQNIYHFALKTKKVKSFVF